MVKIFSGMKMSRAEKRNGERVYRAAKALEAELSQEACGFMTVGEVVSAADMSMPTVKKYLDIMADLGAMQRCVIAGRQYIYRFAEQVNPS